MNENKEVNNNENNQQQQQQQQQRQQVTNNERNQINLLDIKIDNENTALNVLVGFINIAQKRGVYAINESAKIHECIQFFIKNV
tara:strand:+ start:432 stop:683 length:252 start_codon:yes stop_codon:yes gene_type:complete